MKKTILILAFALIYFVYNKLEVSGFFKEINNYFTGTIVKIYDNMPGTEDIDVDRKNGIMFISADDRWANRRGAHSESNGIYMFIPDSMEMPIKIQSSYRGEFHPHGISYFTQDSLSYLYVVNHNKLGDFVELFEYNNGHLIHLKSISNPMMCCPNDIVGLDTNRFYVTNDHGNKTGFMRKLEDYGGLAKSYLIYYNNGTFSKVFENLQYANGVNLSNDGAKLYLTHTTGGELFVIDRDVETGLLGGYESFNLKTGVDNIDVDDEGNIWIGCHPQLLKFVGHSANPEKLSPSQVLKIIPNESYKVEEVYVNDGTELSGSSVAVQIDGNLYIGVVFENKLLRGKLN